MLYLRFLITCHIISYLTFNLTLKLMWQKILLKKVEVSPGVQLPLLKMEYFGMRFINPNQ